MSEDKKTAPTTEETAKAVDTTAPAELKKSPAAEAVAPTTKPDAATEVATDVKDAVAEMVELPDRPLPAETRMETFKHQTKRGLDYKASEKLMADMRTNIGTLARGILEGKITGMELPTLAEIDADKALNRKFAISVAHTIIASLSDSKPHKKLGKALKKAGSASAIMIVIDAYGGSDKTDIDNLFAESVLAMYGLILPDKVLAKLKACSIEIEGKNVTLHAELSALLGGEPNENHAPGQVLTKIMAENAMLAEADPAKAVKLAELLKKCREGRFANLKSEDKTLTSVLAEIASFGEELEKAQSILGDAAIIAEVDLADEAERQTKISTLEKELASEEDVLQKTKLQINIEDGWLKANSRPSTPEEKAEFERRQFNKNGLLSDSEQSKTRVASLKESITKLKFAPNEGSRGQKVELAKAKAALVGKVESFAAHIQRRIDKLAAASVNVDMSGFPKLKAFLEAIASMTATTTDDKVKHLESALGTTLNILEIQKELGGFALAIVEKRDYNEEELALTFLNAKYVDMGYTKQQAEMASIIEYTRRERESALAQFMHKANEAKEQAMDGGIKRFWKEKIKKEVEYITAERGMQLCARNPRMETEQVESDALEALIGKNDYVSVRRYLLEGRISRNALTTFMYELMSLVGGRSIDDGTFMNLKTPADIGKIENMVLNINKFLAEDSSLEIITRAEELATTPEGKAMARAEILAKSLRAYNDEIANTEILLATRAFTSDSSILSKAKIKEGVMAILAQIDESGMTKEQFMQELQRHGINGLENGFAINRLRMNQVKRGIPAAGKAIWNGTTWVGNTVKNGFVTAYTNKGKAARKLFNIAKWPFVAPFRLAGKILSKTSDLVDKTKFGIQTGTIRLMSKTGGAVTQAVGIPYGMYKAFKSGVQNEAAAGKIVLDNTTAQISAETGERIAMHTGANTATASKEGEVDDSQPKAA